MTPAEELRERMRRLLGDKLPDRVTFTDVDGGVLIDPNGRSAPSPPPGEDS